MNYTLLLIVLKIESRLNRRLVRSSKEEKKKMLYDQFCEKNERKKKKVYLQKNAKLNKHEECE